MIKTALLEEVIIANQHFVTHLPDSYYAVNLTNGKLPNRHLALVTCMDTRLVDFLEPALGIRSGEAKIIKNAGNCITGPFDSTIRSLVVGIFELGVKEIMVVGHHDCGVAHATSQDLMERMIQRGISSAAIKMVQHELEDWVDEFHHPIQNVMHAVEKIRSNPLIPADVPIHGLIFNPKTGKVDRVVNGYEALE